LGLSPPGLAIGFSANGASHTEDIAAGCSQPQGSQ
jgi:hypothetical protein